MRLLLDTHSFLWWAFGDTALSKKARAAIADDDAEIFVSAATAWEITTKYRIGKLPHAEFVAKNVEATIADRQFLPLPISIRHAQTAGALAGTLRDPFDRMLIAQAMIEDLTLVSNETAFDAYAVRRLW